MSQVETHNDPKTIQLLRIVDILDHVAWFLPDTPTKAAKLLGSLLAEIQVQKAPERSDDKDFIELCGEVSALQKSYVFEFDSFIDTLTDQDVRIHFFKVSQYLNHTYLKEFSSLRFRNPKRARVGMAD